MSWRRVVVLIWLAGFLASAGPTANVHGAPAAADPRERFFGAVQSIYNPDRAAQAGVQWERLIFPWSLIQKNGPNTWSDGYFTDQQIAQEAARGIDIVGLATYTPQWATSTPKNAKPTNVPANLYKPFDEQQQQQQQPVPCRWNPACGCSPRSAAGPRSASGRGSSAWWFRMG
jgi:hypothetical protein